MSPADYVRCAVAPALSLLPPALDTPAARRMLVAIALQESGLRHRRQVRGPARGYLQFEGSGLTGVLDHQASRDMAASVIRALGYDTYARSDLHEALADNDILCAAMGRLLLWTDRRPLPTVEAAGWDCYLALWRPGRPHPERWPACWAEAEGAV